MLAGDFARKLHKLNPRLFVFAGNDGSKSAGLWYLTKDDQYQPICGVDKNFIHELSRYDTVGHVIHGGWLRVVKILSDSKLIDRFESYKHFGNWSLHRQPPFVQEMSQIDRDIRELYIQEANRGHMNTADLLDVGAELAKKKAH